MIVELGQDATGRWAWMIRDQAGRVLASHDDYPNAESALAVALARARREGWGGKA